MNFTIWCRAQFTKNRKLRLFAVIWPGRSELNADSNKWRERVRAAAAHQLRAVIHSLSFTFLFFSGKTRPRAIEMRLKVGDCSSGFMEMEEHRREAKKRQDCLSWENSLHRNQLNISRTQNHWRSSICSSLHSRLVEWPVICVLCFCALSKSFIIIVDKFTRRRRPVSRSFLYINQVAHQM